MPDHGTGSLSDGVISTSNETMISDISNQTITLTNDMAASTSGSVTTAQNKLTADVLVNALQGNVKGVYEEVFGTYKLVATNPYPVVTSAMYVGVDTNKGMVYYKIAFANPKAPVITTDLTTTAVTGTELRVVANAPDKAPCPTSGTRCPAAAIPWLAPTAPPIRQTTPVSTTWSSPIPATA